MSWAGRECVIPALFVEPGSSTTKASSDDGDTALSPAAGDQVCEAKMEFIPDDDSKGEEEKK